MIPTEGADLRPDGAPFDWQRKLLPIKGKDPTSGLTNGLQSIAQELGFFDGTFKYNRVFLALSVWLSVPTL